MGVNVVQVRDDIISNTNDAFLHFQGCCLVQSFADHSHRASIRSVCANGKFMASGSADETIHVYDMKARKESGMLVHHNGKVKMKYRIYGVTLN